MISGKHLIAGNWVAGEETFESSPAHGPARHYSMGTPEHIDRACVAAEAAFSSYSQLPREIRARFLERIADEIELLGKEITEIGTAETGLPAARLDGERQRTIGQLRLFASHIRKGDYLDRRHDLALPDRTPAPRPDIRLIQQAVGPVAVFGASNFPLAFSVAGGDTASALAAGCPVVVKGHSAHPGTSEIVAQAIDAAIKACGIDPGVFGLIQGGKRNVGEALVRHPLIAAVGFTGSLTGGRALFDLCAARPIPIPFFGELGSVNPVFVLPGALAARGGAIATAWAASLTMGAGQFCTNPGIVVLIDGQEASAFIDTARRALEGVAAQTMLTDGIAAAYNTGINRIGKTAGAKTLIEPPSNDRQAMPALYEVSGDDFLASHDLASEVFGPLGLVVRAKDVVQLHQIVRGLEGQLTCTLQMDEGDNGLAKSLLPTLLRKAGRVLANGFPTGVEVCDAMVHGGPYPASTNFGATSVGTLSIRRWLRPVSLQNMPDALIDEIW
jgi:2,5-dioxopentanoate dehydrogenase